MTNWAITGALIAFLTAPGIAAGQTPTGQPNGDWRNVDAVRPGTRLVVTLSTGERRTGRFLRSTVEDVVLDVARRGNALVQVEEVSLPKTRIATVAIHDPVSDGTRNGALAGGGAMLAMMQAGWNACGIGCENDMPRAALFVAGAFGAGVGSALGFLVDRLDDRSEILYPPPASTPHSSRRPVNRFFPARSSLRIGPLVAVTGFRSALVHGSSAAPGFAVAGQIAPYVSLHAEYTSRGPRFYPAAGSVPDSVLQNVVPATSRAAGFSHGIESRRVLSTFSELAGVHPPPWRRVRLEFLAGVSVQGREERDYYDAWRDLGQGTASDPFRHERIPGKYYVLNFESPVSGLVYGIDAEIAATPRLVVVPTIRYTTTNDPGATIAFGIGAHWRF